MAADLRSRVNQLFTAVVPTLASLYGRWQDERAYEDIKDYAIPIKAALPTDVHFIRMTKSPFGFTFAVGDAVFRMTINSRVARWTQIGG